MRDSGIGSSIGSTSSRSFSTQSSVNSSCMPGRGGASQGKTSNISRINSSFNSNLSFTSTQQSRSFNQTSNDFNRGSTQNSKTGNGRLPLTTITGSALNVGNTDSGNVVVCNCGADAKLLTVRKEGPNTGE